MIETLEFPPNMGEVDEVLPQRVRRERRRCVLQVSSYATLYRLYLIYLRTIMCVGIL